MYMFSFEWDPRKASTNKRKHGVSFEEARTVFYDDNARVIDDPEHSEAEDRFVIIGVSERLRVLVVCHCVRKNDNVIRIISARSANRAEQTQYEEHLP